MTDEQIADERAFEGYLRTMGDHDDIERIRAAFGLQATDPEEAERIFGPTLDTERNKPIVGVDHDPLVGAIMVRYEALAGRVLIRTASPDFAKVVYDPTPEALRAGYEHAKEYLRERVQEAALAAVTPPRRKWRPTRPRP